MKETINQRVAHARKLVNLTQQAAAEKLGMKCSTYSQMERKGNISAQMLLKLADIYKVPVEYLFYGKDFKELIINDPPIITGSQPDITEPEPDPIKPEPETEPPFILTPTEENVIKILRNLKKDTSRKLIDLIEEEYKNSFKKK